MLKSSSSVFVSETLAKVNFKPPSSDYIQSRQALLRPRPMNAVERSQVAMSVGLLASVQHRKVLDIVMVDDSEQVATLRLSREQDPIVGDVNVQIFASSSNSDVVYTPSSLRATH